MINTHLAEMPPRIHSYVVASGYDDYTIILNARLSYEMRMEAYQHELAHIQNGDLEKKCSADLVELYAHKEMGL